MQTNFGSQVYSLKSNLGDGDQLKKEVIGEEAEMEEEYYTF